MTKKTLLMKKSLLLVTVLIPMLMIQTSRAGDYKNFQDQIYKAYVEDRMSLWRSTLLNMEYEYQNNPDDALLYDILLGHYGLIGYYLGTDHEDKAKKMLEKAEPYLDIMYNRDDYEARAKLFEAAFNGFRIGLRPLRGVSLGPKSATLIDDALEIDPSYPRGYIEKGNHMYYAPSMFGGSKSKAIEHYKKAIDMLEEGMANNHRWLYLNTLTVLAEAYNETGSSEKAIAILEKALTFEPDFHWVKEELLPSMKE